MPTYFITALRGCWRVNISFAFRLPDA